MCKRLKDYKEEIHRCSKCGICQHACPVYQETGNDCTVSRGQFIMLDGVIKGELKLDKNVNKYLDLCMKCGKCKSACPTGIDVVDIILSAKHEYFKHSLEGKIYSVLESKLVFNSLLRLLELAGRVFSNGKWKMENGKLVDSQSGTSSKQPLSQISKLVNSLRNFSLSPRGETTLCNHSICHSEALVEESNISRSDLPIRQCDCQEDEKRTRAVYFGGCIEKLHPEVRDYVRELLHLMNIELVDVKFDCCGMPFLTTGNLDRFEEQKRENLKKLEGLEFDYFVTDCASCEYVWNELCGIKVTNIYELIAGSDLEFVAKRPATVTYHKPCHEKSMEYIEKVLNKCHNIDYKELDGYDECCGFAGLEHPTSFGIWTKLSKKKAKNIEKTGADYVLTTCAGCTISIGLAAIFKTKVKRLITFLKENCKISSK